MLYQLCRERTDLSLDDIRRLEEVRQQLPMMAELTGADVFIDCAGRDGSIFVVAQARPSTAASAYKQDVVGQSVFVDREPAVFNALETNTPVRDIKAITQEDRAVRQDVVPIVSEDGRCIGLLIRELDISDDLLQEKKYQRLARTFEDQDPSLRARDTLAAGDPTALREVHHRVKNNLQLVASILNIQARRCGDDFTKKILQENVSRVLSIAAIHDILNQDRDGSFQRIESITLLDQLRKNLQSFVPEGKRITIRVTGDSVMLTPDIASSVSLVVNELITNALEHAFEGREAGSIIVSFLAGSLFHTVTVADDGVGFDVTQPRTGSLGLNIVDMTVKDKLRGHMTMTSGSGGSRISFDFKTE